MTEAGVRELLKSAQDLMTGANRDLLVFSGPIDDDTCDTFTRSVLDHKPRRDRALLFLCTYGGNPHAAYRMARLLRRCYPDGIRILIGGQCKSAGTLVALCAESLGFSEMGELGPLDTQLTRPDEVLQRASGLEVFSTLQYLTDHAFSCFEKNMLAIISRSGQTVSTRLASGIASKLATGLLKPITAQLDPYRIGLAQRGLEVTKVYGRQLANPRNLKTDAATLVHHLVNDYPTHEFVIDQEEAGTLFENVDGLKPAEQAFFEQMIEPLSLPAENPVILNFATAVAIQASEEQQEENDGSPKQHHRKGKTNGQRESGSPTPESQPNGRYPSSHRKGQPTETTVENQGTHVH